MQNLSFKYSKIMDNIKLEEGPSSPKAAHKHLQTKLVEFDAATYYLNSILSNMSQGLLFIEFSGGVTTYNPAAEKILGVAGKHVLFHRFWDNFRDEVFGFSMKEALSQKKAPGALLANLDLLTGERRELEVDASIMLHKEDPRQPPIDAMEGMIVLIRDITEIRHLQLIAQRHDRLEEIGEMAATVAHEIRNPLGGIKGFASLLQRDLHDRPDLQKMAAYIVEGTDDLNRLVSNVLNYARPVQPFIQQLDLAALLREVHDHVHADTNIDPLISMVLKIPEQSIIAPIDHALIKSVLLNLIVNAIQAMPKGGVLTLSLDSGKDYAQIIVTDTGVGIAPENIRQLYSPFFTTKVQGNGVGLAEVLKIMQAHGGTINVASQIGQGTSFTLKFPLKRLIYDN